MSLIDREALIAEYDRVHVGEPGRARQLMINAPTIEPERKVGKWIIVTDNRGQHAECQFCGEWKYHQGQNFCGECGAKMEEGDRS